jgi:hypothetical protein
MLSHDDVQSLTDKIVYYGELMIIRDITSYLIPIFPRVNMIWICVLICKKKYVRFIKHNLRT